MSIRAVKSLLSGPRKRLLPPHSMSIRAVKRFHFNKFLMLMVVLLLLFGLFNLVTPTAALAVPSTSLEIMGEGVTNPRTFNLDELKELDQHQQLYSAINTWPTKKWYVGEGVKLRKLLDLVGMEENARLLKFYSNDGYTVTLTVKELLEDKRYCFPHFKDTDAGDGDGDGNIRGSTANKKEVEPIIGLISVEGSDNPDYMTDLNSLLLMLGQRAVTEQTGNLFVKYLDRIEVLNSNTEKWDNPQANPPSGEVPAGTMIALSNQNMDDDKVYYTMDGSTPTYDSPMYNWIARRWWSSRADVLGDYNHPIGPINENTTIKAITIGPGKYDSDVVTFSYQVAGPGSENGDNIPGEVKDEPDKSMVIKLTIGQLQASVDNSPYELEAAPYITQAGRTLVPVRFVSEALRAAVDWDEETEQVIINDEGKKIVLSLGSSDVLINGSKQTIDCTPEMLPPGRVFVPLRFVVENLGAVVDYEDETKLITITR